MLRKQDNIIAGVALTEAALEGVMGKPGGADMAKSILTFAAMILPKRHLNDIVAKHGIRLNYTPQLERNAPPDKP